MVAPVRGLRRVAALVGLRLPLVLPEDPASFPTTNDYSPLLHFGTAEHELSVRIAQHIRRQRHGRFLDVGGGTGGSSRHLAGRYQWNALDIVTESDDVILADICDCPEVPDATFDIVFSRNTYEHLPRPWRAAAETARILKPGGLALVSTCFAWRFHPVPGDYFRFSHMGLELLFEDAGLETITSGYDLSLRRMDFGSKLTDGFDAAPADDLGGFRENWTVYYAGRRPT